MIVIYRIWSLCSDKKKAIKIFLISIFVVFIIYLLTKDFISDAILGLTKYTPDMMQKRRITEIAGLIKNFGFESEGGMLNRFNLYFLSLDTFIKNPIFGVGFRDEILHTTVNVVNPLIGGHSTILDYLASYGVFGFIYIGMIPAFFVKL
ncbi:MAG: O-antigen ligase family protein, partial [Bacilli bacterium]